MQKRFYSKERLNKLIVVKKPIFVSSNAYLNKIKRKYKNKKAGFSGTLDPFAKGCLIVAFGQYSKLFNYLSKTPKTYRAVIWLGTTSDSFDIENVISINDEKKLDKNEIESVIKTFTGNIKYTPPKYSAKKVDGKRAYDLARDGKEVELKESTMNISNIKFLKYNHPYISFETTVSEGTYIRSLAQLICNKLGVVGTLSYLERVNEGKFFFEDEKDLNPLDYLDLSINKYSGSKEWVAFGKKISIDYLEIKDDGIYLIVFDDMFSIIKIENSDVSYLLNKVELNV